MASNISQLNTPGLWSSANDDCIFTFSFNPYAIDSIVTDGGNAKINLYDTFDVTPVPGEYIYINSNVYIGTYKILTVYGAAAVTIDTPYISGVTSLAYNCYHLRVPIFSYYKGFTPSETYPNDLPYTKVVDYKPSVLYDATTGIPYLEINTKGINKRIFTITSNTVANSVDFSMFNVVRFVWDNLTTDSGTSNYNCVLNSSITNDELILNYTLQGKYLLPIDKPLIASQGTSFYTVFEYSVDFPKLHKFINGVKQ